MNARRILFTAAVAALLPLCSMAQEGGIELKGLRVGMSEEEVKAKVPSWQDFTIAGIERRSGDMAARREYFDGKLDSVLLLFQPAEFDRVRLAFAEKYPTLQCSTSAVSTAAGGLFTQEICQVSDDTSVLQLRKFAGSVRNSVVYLTSRRLVEERAKLDAQRRKDI